MNSIIFENISFKANGRTILSRISGRIQKGEKFALVGDNGSGKSTLLEILLGDLMPGLALSLWYQDGRPTLGQAHTLGHL